MFEGIYVGTEGGKTCRYPRSRHIVLCSYAFQGAPTACSGKFRLLWPWEVGSCPPCIQDAFLLHLFVFQEAKWFVNSFPSFTDILHNYHFIKSWISFRYSSCLNRKHYMVFFSFVWSGIFTLAFLLYRSWILPESRFDLFTIASAPRCSVPIFSPIGPNETRLSVIIAIAVSVSKRIPLAYLEIFRKPWSHVARLQF